MTTGIVGATGAAGAAGTTGPSLTAENVSLAYDDRPIVHGLSVTIPTGKITVVVGANACGKSTLLRGLARLLRPQVGAVLLDGQDIHRLPTREVARRLGMLPQQPIAPEGITVADLVGRGRHPHQRWFRQWSPADERAVEEALDATGTADLADRPVDELSGGQRQRAWIALALAQGTDLMLLDEPTTFLDLAHQIEVLDLLADLNRREERTIVAVLHDLNLACRYAHHLVAMAGGAIVAEGPPREVVDASLVSEVFGLECLVLPDPVTDTPLIVPVPAQHRGQGRDPAVAGSPVKLTGDRGLAGAGGAGTEAGAEGHDAAGAGANGAGAAAGVGTNGSTEAATGASAPAGPTGEPEAAQAV